MAEQWYSIVEYARAYSISDMTVRRRIKNGKLHAVLKDGKYFIPVNETVSSPAPAAPVKREPVYPDAIERSNYTSYTTQSKTPSYTQTRPNESRSQLRSSSELSPRPVASRPSRHFDNIPNSVHTPVSQAEKLVMQADALLAFCDRALGDLNESKRNHRDLYEAKIKTLEAKLTAKEMEVSQFKQQVEDLQVLVKILEKKNQS